MMTTTIMFYRRALIIGFLAPVLLLLTMGDLPVCCSAVELNNNNNEDDNANRAQSSGLRKESVNEVLWPVVKLDDNANSPDNSPDQSNAMDSQPEVNAAPKGHDGDSHVRVKRGETTAAIAMTPNATATEEECPANHAAMKALGGFVGFGFVLGTGMLIVSLCMICCRPKASGAVVPTTSQMSVSETSALAPTSPSPSVGSPPVPPAPPVAAAQ